MDVTQAKRAAAVARQLEDLTRDNDRLAGEAEELRGQLAAAREDMAILRELLDAAGVEVPAELLAASGDDDGRPPRQRPGERSRHRDAAAVEADLPLVDGDGLIPAAALSRLQPCVAGTAPVNITCVVALPPAGDAVVLIAAGANKTLVAIAVDGSGRELAGARAVATCAAPALHIARVPSPTWATSHTCHVVTSHMDGSVALWQLRLDAAGPSLTLTACGEPSRVHDKYITEVAVSPNGRWALAVSHDGSASLFAVNASPSASALTLVQRLFWRASVDAVDWSVRNDTAVVAVAKSPTLYYLRLDEAAHASSAAGADGAERGGLASAPAFTQLPDGSTSYPTLLPSMRIALRQIPLSDDGQPAAIAGAPGAASRALLERESVATASLVTLVRPVEEGDAMEGGSTPPVASPSMAIAVARAAGAGAGAGAGAAVAGPLLHASDTAAALSSSADVTAGGAFVPVGFSITALAACPNATPAGHALLAAAADTIATVFVFRWGSNTLLRRLVGHDVGATLSVSTRLCWLSPHYLAVTSGRHLALAVYSVGAGRVVHWLGRDQAMMSGEHVDAAIAGAGAGVSADGSAGEDGRAPLPLRQTVGHTASIKAVAPVQWPALGGGHGTSSGRGLVSCGFDKAAILWR